MEISLDEIRVIGFTGALLSFIAGFIRLFDMNVFIIDVILAEILVLIAAVLVSIKYRDASIGVYRGAKAVLAILFLYYATTNNLYGRLDHVLGSFGKGFDLREFVSLILLFWIFNLIGAMFVYLSYHKITIHTGYALFKDTGILYLLGAALLIILIGLFILFLAYISEMIAWATLKHVRVESTKRKIPPPPPPPPEIFS